MDAEEEPQDLEQAVVHQLQRLENAAEDRLLDSCSSMVSQDTGTYWPKTNASPRQRCLRTDSGTARIAHSSQHVGRLAVRAVAHELHDAGHENLEKEAEAKRHHSVP